MSDGAVAAHCDLVANRLLGQRMLAAMIDEDPEQIAAVIAEVDRRGEIAFRHATHEVRMHLALLRNQAPGFRITGADLFRGVLAIMGRAVPAAKRDEVMDALLPLLQRHVEDDVDNPMPEATGDTEADLYLAAAYGAWLASQTELDPPAVRARLDQIITSLRRDTTLDPALLDPSQLDAAFAVLADRFGQRFADELPRTGLSTFDMYGHLVSTAYQCHLSSTDDADDSEQAVYLRYLRDLLVDAVWEPDRLTRPVHTVTHETTTREDAVAMRLSALLQKRTHAGVAVVFDTGTTTYTVSWTGGPEIDAMREYVGETARHQDDAPSGSHMNNPEFWLDLVEFDRIEYHRNPMPDLRELAVEAVDTRDPRGWWSASRRRRETAEVLRRLEDLASHGYTAVEGFMSSVRQHQRR